MAFPTATNPSDHKLRRLPKQDTVLSRRCSLAMPKATNALRVHMIPSTFRDQLNGLVEALLQESQQSQCQLVGHDWGAVIGYLMVEHRPDLYKSYVSLGIPGGMSWLKMVTRCPTYLVNSFYIVIFQIPGFAEWLFQRQNYRFMRWLVGLWSPRLKADNTFLDSRVETMDQAGVLKASLSYYRNSFYGLNSASFKTRSLLTKPIQIPVLAIRGEDDFGVPASTWECISPKQFKAGITLESMKDAGHFFQIEEPKEISDRIISWISE